MTVDVAGYERLMADAKTPSDYDYNVKVTRNVVDMAHFFYVHFQMPAFFKNIFEGHVATQYMKSGARPDIGDPEGVKMLGTTSLAFVCRGSLHGGRTRCGRRRAGLRAQDHRQPTHAGLQS